MGSGPPITLASDGHWDVERRDQTTNTQTGRQRALHSASLSPEQRTGQNRTAANQHAVSELTENVSLRGQRVTGKRLTATTS